MNDTGESGGGLDLDGFRASMERFKGKYAAQARERAARLPLTWAAFAADPDAAGLEAVLELAHKLAGSGATLGLPRTGERARDLEYALKEHVETGRLPNEGETAALAEMVAAVAAGPDLDGSV
jgi:HPt (histidine-containing phosphotransfer) domain-containing protein